MAKRKPKSPHSVGVLTRLAWIDRVIYAIDSHNGTPSYLSADIKAFREKLGTFRDGVVTGSLLGSGK